MSFKMRRWLLLPLAVLALSLYLIGYRIYQHRAEIVDPPATVLTEEQLLSIDIMDGETININEADVKEFMRLPGVGEVIAKRICEKRTRVGKFQTLDELKEVKGIGEKLYRKIEQYIVLE